MSASFPGWQYLRRFFRELGAEPKTLRDIDILPERQVVVMAIAAAPGASASTQVDALSGLTVEVPVDETWVVQSASLRLSLTVGQNATGGYLWNYPRERQAIDGVCLCLAGFSTNNVQQAQRCGILPHPMIMEHGDRLTVEMRTAAGEGGARQADARALIYRFPRGLAPRGM